MDAASENFEIAFGGATDRAFGGAQTSTDDKTVRWCGFRLSPHWTACLYVFAFVAVIFAGFCGIHASRIINGPSGNNTSSNSNNSSSSNGGGNPSPPTDVSNTTATTTIMATTTTTLITATSETPEIAPTTTASPNSNNDNSGTTTIYDYLDQHTQAVSVISLCVTVPIFLFAMSMMFLAVFVDPGRLPRLHEITAQAEQRHHDEFMRRFEQQQQKNKTRNNQDGGGGSSSAAADNSPNDVPGLQQQRTAGVFSDTSSTIEPAALRGSGAVPTADAEAVDLAAEIERAKAAHLPPGQSVNAEFLTVNGVNIPTPFCTTCKIRRPVRASHCVHCQCCVRGFDHECTVIGACVGECNLRFFTGFVWGIGALCWTVFISCVIVAIAAANNTNSKYFIFSVGYAVVAGICGLQLGCNLSCLYCFLVFKGYTYREHIKRDTIFGVADQSPFSIPNKFRQLAYLWCPLPPDVSAKDWAESNGKAKSTTKASSTTPPRDYSPGLSLGTVSPSPGKGVVAADEKSPLSFARNLDYGSGGNRRSSNDAGQLGQPLL